MWVAGGAAKGAPPWRAAVLAASAGVSVTRTRAVALKLLPAGRSVTGQRSAGKPRAARRFFFLALRVAPDAHQRHGLELATVRASLRLRRPRRDGTVPGGTGSVRA